MSQSVITRDASGNITDDKELQSDGSTIEAQFSNGVETNEIVTDTNGDLAKTVAFNTDGSTVETDFSAPDANGDQVAQSVIARDASGNITDDKELQADGSTIETQFSGGSKTNEIVTDANGDLSETIAFNPDGSTLEKDFSAPDVNGDQIAQSIIERDASGNITDDKELQSDSSTIETQFSNGVETNELFTDANGNLTKTIAFNADDSQTISTFDAQGHVTLTQDINASGTLVSAVARDDAGNVTSDKELQGDGTYIETQFDNGVTTAQIFSDANGNLSKIIDFNDDGSTTVRTFNDQGDVSLVENFDPNGNFVSADGTSAAGVAFSQVGQGVGATFTFGNIPLDFSDAAVSGGEALGSAIGKALGGNNLALEIGGATILGTVSKNLAASLVTLAGFTTNAGMPSPLSGLLNDALNNTFSDLGIQLPSTLSGLGGELGNVGVGQISSLLTSEVANALGLKGFGAGLFDAVGTTITGTVTDDASLVQGFPELQKLDSNGDGVLNASDSTWSSLKVWVDPTGTANFQSGQLESLAQLGITSINLNATQESVDNNGNTIVADSSFTYANGTTGDIAGVDLTFDPNTVEGAGGNSSTSQGTSSLSSTSQSASPSSAPGTSGLASTGQSQAPCPSSPSLAAGSSSDTSPSQPQPDTVKQGFNAAGQLSFDQIYDAMSGALKETDQYQYNATGKLTEIDRFGGSGGVSSEADVFDPATSQQIGSYVFGTNGQVAEVADLVGHHDWIATGNGSFQDKITGQTASSLPVLHAA